MSKEKLHINDISEGTKFRLIGYMREMADNNGLETEYFITGIDKKEKTIYAESIYHIPDALFPRELLTIRFDDNGEINDFELID